MMPRAMNSVSYTHLFIDGFEDGLVGTKKGEQKSLNLTFPEEYHSEELAGKDVVFEVTVNAVKERVVPELTDAFVAEKYPDYETVEKLKAELYDGMLKQEQQNIDNQRDTDILNHIVENSEIVCSTDEIDDAYNIQLNSYITMLTGYGMDIKSYADVYKRQLWEHCWFIPFPRFVLERLSMTCSIQRPVL